MTKKHFIALAAMMAETRPIEPDPEGIRWLSVESQGRGRAQYNAALSQWRCDVRGIASVCAGINGRFDTRFYDACGYEIRLSDTEGAKS